MCEALSELFPEKVPKSPIIDTPARRIFSLLNRTFMVMPLLLIADSIAQVLNGNANWGPIIGGKSPCEMEVWFQARAAGFEADDRLSVVALNMPPQHTWVEYEKGQNVRFRDNRQPPPAEPTRSDFLNSAWSAKFRYDRQLSQMFFCPFLLHSRFAAY